LKKIVAVVVLDLEKFQLLPPFICLLLQRVEDDDWSVGRKHCHAYTRICN
jgi:hypothetical protein